MEVSVYRACCVAVLGTACVLNIGCGNANGLYPVRGKVMYKGEPATGAAVYFHRKDAPEPLKEQTLQGIVQQDGAFELAGADGPGAIPGDYIVLIEWKKGPGIKAPDRFKGKYLSMKKPLFTAQVQPKTNDLPAFEIP
jgi:hypothetical protein